MISEILSEAALEIDRCLNLVPATYAEHRVEIEQLRDSMVALAGKLAFPATHVQITRRELEPGEAA